MKILILSCNTGEGHNAAGHAVEEAALARGHEVNFVDAMQLGKRHTSRLISGLYIGIVKHLPWFFGFIYKLGMLISNRGLLGKCKAGETACIPHRRRKL